MKHVLILSLALAGSVSAFAAAPAAQSLDKLGDAQLGMKVIADVAGVFAKCPAQYGQIAVASIETAVSEARKTSDVAERKQKAAQLLSDSMNKASAVAPTDACLAAGSAVVASGSEVAKRTNTNAYALAQQALSAMAQANQQVSDEAAKASK